MTAEQAYKIVFNEGLHDNLKKVDKKLLEIAKDANSKIKHATIDLVKSGGKRLRPAIVILSALAAGSDVSDDVLSCAAAIEIVHIASLVHDDIIDKSKLRWGKPTVVQSMGADFAIILGDYLFSRGSAIAGKVSQSAGVIVSEAISTICIGQDDEMEDDFNDERTVETYLNTVSQKTAALFVASTKLGGLCAGVDEHKLEKFAEYGQSFGMAFQVIDDLLDLTATEAGLGKPVGNDLLQGNYTLPILLGLKTSEGGDLKQLLTQKSSLSDVIKFLESSGAIEETLSLIKKYIKTAETVIGVFDEKAAEPLMLLPSAFFKWSMDKQNVS